MTKLYYLLLIISCMSCNNTTEKKTMFINSYKVDCVGVGPMQCLQIKYAESEDWSYFYDGIDGFNFEPGYIYQIDVSVDTLDTNTLPADKSNLKYSLLNIVSKKRDMTYRLNDIWVVTHMMNKKLDKTSLRLPQLEFSLKTKKVIGTDGCNNVRGSIRRITDTELEFGPIIGTKKLCPQMEIPNAFNRVIATVTHYKIENRTLYFYNKNKNEVMQCLKVD